jgi:TolB-like protein/Tfp pilus assembly protein PilF
MSRFIQLVREIHRRSIWQVLGIYLFASWIVFQVVQTFTEGLGLPEWIPGLASVLLLIGLPIVLATAFVQEGVGRSAPEHSSKVEASDAGPASMSEASEAAGVRGMFTWRKALVGGALAFGLWGVIATGWLIFGDRAVAESIEGRKSVAVLPFVNMSADPENEYFSDGITETIIAHLSRIADLKVISRTSVMQYKDTDKNVRQIAEELEVATILEGSVQRSGDRLQITAQLIDAESDDHMWAEQYNRELTDIFSIQSEVAEEIAAVLKATLTAAEREQIERPPTLNIDAYNLYLLGRSWWNKRTADGLERAIEYFDQAVEQDPNYALAHVALAETYALLPWYAEWPPAETYPRATAAALRALEIDDRLGEAHNTLAAVRTWYDWDLSSVEQGYREALALSPNYSTAHHWYGQFLGYVGRLDEAMAELELARELDPLSSIINTNLADLYYLQRRYDEAIERYETILELEPGFGSAYWGLGKAYLQKGMFEEAVEALRFEDSGELTAAYTALGRDSEAAAVLEASRDRSLRNQLAAHVGVGDVDGAFAILERAYEERASFLLEEPNNDPYYDGLRSDARYTELMQRIGLQR